VGMSTAAVGAPAMVNSMVNRIAQVRQVYDGDLGRFLGFIMLLAEMIANPALTFALVSANPQLAQCLQ